MSYHLSVPFRSDFDCPICTCNNQPEDWEDAWFDSYRCGCVLKCKGCKRDLNFVLDIVGVPVVWEWIDGDEASFHVKENELRKVQALLGRKTMTIYEKELFNYRWENGDYFFKVDSKGFLDSKEKMEQPKEIVLRVIGEKSDELKKVHEILGRKKLSLNEEWMFDNYWFDPQYEFRMDANSKLNVHKITA